MPAEQPDGVQDTGALTPLLEGQPRFRAEHFPFVGYVSLAAATALLGRSRPSR